MTRRVIWRPAAQADLLSLYDWIAEQADRGTAFAYTGGIEARVATLSDFSARGSPRDDLAPGIRTIIYRRRTTIAYRLVDDAVEVVRLGHAGRDLSQLFGEDDN